MHWRSLLLLLSIPVVTFGQAKTPKATVPYPPPLLEGKEVVTDTDAAFLKAPATIAKDVPVPKQPPTVDLLYFPGQTYEGKPWSNWGDSLAVNGKYYASVGDHLAPQGNAFVYEYDPAKKTFRQLVDLKKTIDLPAGHYMPGKIHSRLDMDKDGWLYFATHRGSTKVTTDQYHYKGDWIIRTHPVLNKTEILAVGPVPKHCIPTSAFDVERRIFYGGTAPGVGNDGEGVRFFAFDTVNKKVLYDAPDGPPRAMILAQSTGRVYYVPGKDEANGNLVRFDPKDPTRVVPIAAKLGLRAATTETADGIVYTVSKGGKDGAIIYAFNTKTETAEELGLATVGSQSYITSLDVDPLGRYLYYVPGAHGGSDKDGTAVVRFDIKTKKREVIAFLHDFYKSKYGLSLVGTYSTALDPQGDKLYITWNANRGSKNWDTCALTVLHLARE